MTPDRTRGLCMDSLGAILASYRNDHASVAVLVMHLDDDEVYDFIGATIRHGAQLLQVASYYSGLAPEAIAGYVASNLRETAP